MSISMPKPVSTIHLAEHYFQPKIDLIQHLIQYSQNILLILAPKKGGKTAFANFCLTHSTPELKKHFLLVTPDLSIESMMDNIANGFGMSWPPQEPSIHQAVQKIWTLFVDDAHLLSSDKLEALVRLVNFHQEPKRQLHLVLLGEDQLAQSFSSNRITHLVGSYSTIIELALPQNWQLKSSYTEEMPNPNSHSTPHSIPNYPDFGSQPEEFSVQTQSTHRDFEEAFEFGLAPNFNAPRNTDLLDDSLLDALDILEDRPVPLEEKNKGFYQTLFFHPVSYGLYLGIFVGVSFLFWQGKEIDRPKLVEETQTQSMSLAMPEPEPDLVLFEPPPVLAEAPKASAPAIISPTPIEQASSESFESANIIQAEPKPAHQIKKPIVNKAVANKAANKSKALKTASKDVKIPKPIQPQRMASPENVILAKNSTHYTVQLYSSIEPQKVAYFKQQHGLDKAWVIRKKQQGKTWHVLVLGDYPNKSLATKAIERLPKSILQAKINPWIRDFASVQKEISGQAKRG